MFDEKDVCKQTQYMFFLVHMDMNFVYGGAISTLVFQYFYQMRNVREILIPALRFAMSGQCMKIYIHIISKFWKWRWHLSFYSFGKGKTSTRKIPLNSDALVLWAVILHMKRNTNNQSDLNGEIKRYLERTYYILNLRIENVNLCI